MTDGEVFDANACGHLIMQDAVRDSGQHSQRDDSDEAHQYARFLPATDDHGNEDESACVIDNETIDHSAWTLGIEKRVAVLPRQPCLLVLASLGPRASRPPISRDLKLLEGSQKPPSKR